MKKLFAASCLRCVCLLALSISSANAQSSLPTPKLTAPIPREARELVKSATSLIEHDRIREALTALRKAIALAPNYVNAHAEYIRVKACFLNRYDEARAEYENLMTREPDNPVYPMALAIIP